MKISKLRLLGFKSFVDPVELTILPGLTGVVGPNGCGKSNLLEALRWVMGESRPTSMRGAGMEDVIFAGAGTRSPKNFAEVVLGLEDVKLGAQPLISSNGLLEVVRRVTRDLGSSFRLNGKDVRAKDVAMLFADASTGAYSPSLVRQGQITELINANPQSRRRLLEEAAGISGLYQRRHEAELKLKSSEANLGRLQDVTDQLEAQLGALERQARQASKYRELGDEIREAEGSLLCKKWFEGEERKLQEETSLITNIKILKTAEANLLEARTKRDQAELSISEFRKNEADAAASLQRLTVEREGIERDQKRASSIINELKNRHVEIMKDHLRQEGYIRDAGDVIERFNWELNQLTAIDQNSDDTISKHKLDSTKADKELQNAELELDRLSEFFAQLSAKNQNVNEQLIEVKSSFDSVTEELRVLKDQISALLATEMENKDLLKKTEKKLINCKVESDAAEIELRLTEKARAATATRESEKRIESSTADGRLMALVAEREAIKGSLSESRDGVLGVFNDVRIERGFEDALGAAFEDETNAPIILDNQHSGWFELPELDVVPLLPDGAYSISEKAKAPAVLKRRLSFIGLVERSLGPELQKSLKPGQKLVSKNGDLWRWDGFCSLADKKTTRAALMLKQENRLIDLDEDIKAIEKRCNELELELSASRSDFDNAEKKDFVARNLRKNCDQKLSEVSREFSSVEGTLNIISSKIESFTDTVNLKESEKHKLQKELNDLNQQFSQLENIEDSREALEAQRSRVEASRHSMVEKKTLYDQVRRDASNRKIRIEEVESELQNWKNRLNTATESIAELHIRKETLNSELDHAKNQPALLLDNKNKLIETLEKAEKRKAESSEKLAIQEALLRKLGREERIAEEKASETRGEVAKDRVKKENAELSQEELRKVFCEKLGQEPKDFIENSSTEVSKGLPSEEIENRVQRLKNRREALGAVNLRAEEDLKELSQELNNLIVDKEDLESAITKLRTGILTLNSEGRSRLLEAYNTVNENFSGLFQTLFGGGVAKLELVESEDPLDAGLEIMCQPPGKKLSTLSLLSGGEQTLTAISLIFAVFKANPSPICVLDEVDAPLDDANVQRFCGLLDEMKNKTQTRFMIITHHPLTMSRMDRLYGVTMVERGVSQLVSVDLERAEKLLEV